MTCQLWMRRLQGQAYSSLEAARVARPQCELTAEHGGDPGQAEARLCTL